MPIPNWPQSEYLVSERHRLVLITIPKVGCSTLTHWFYRIHGRHPDEMTSRGHAVRNYGLHRQPRERWPQILRDFDVIGFVRDPWQRAVSAYLNKCVNTWSYPPAVALIRKHTPDAASGITFRQFVSLLAEHEPMALDPHWRPVSLFYGGTRCRAIWALRDMTGRLLELNAKLGVDVSAPTVFPTGYAPPRAQGHVGFAANWSAPRLRSLNGYPPWRDFYDRRLRALVAKIYASDIKRFGFKFDHPGRGNYATPTP